MNEERAFLMALLERPYDAITKLVYADWLEERGDPRGEFLRWMVKVGQERVITPEQRQQRHNELSAELEKLRTQERQEWEDAIGDRGPSRENRQRRRRIQELKGQLAKLSKKICQKIPARLQELAATFDPN
jgi:uncharacterized protein (TIGR02996 family)